MRVLSLSFRFIRPIRILFPWFERLQCLKISSYDPSLIGFILNIGGGITPDLVDVGN